MADNVPFTVLDFDTVRNSLKKYLAGQTQFTDYDFEGSNISVILDILAYNTFQNNYYVNMAYSEMFLDSAQLLESAVSHAKELNYLPGSKTSASALIDVTVLVDDGASSVTIPRDTKFIAQCGNETYEFLTRESVSVVPVDGIFKYSGLEVLEGKKTYELFEVIDDSTEFVISDLNVDVGSIRVNVYDNTQADSSSVEYIRSPNLFGVSSSDKVFYVEAHRDGLYKITFGADKFGKQPIVGNVVKIEYRSTVGADANGADSFKASAKIGTYDTLTDTKAKAAGGSNKETIESIKFFAPKALQVQDRAITENDYAVLLKNQFPEISAISVYGGEQLSPPRFGSVAIAIDVLDYDGISQNNQKRYVDFLKDRTPIGIEPIILAPKYMYASVDVVVYYDVRKTSKSVGDISQLVRDAINAFNLSNLGGFGATLRFSKLLQYVDAADESILSNDTFIRSMVPIPVTLNIDNNITETFGAEIKTPTPLIAGSDVLAYDSVITSSSFTYNGYSSSLIDDGLGNIHIISIENSKQSIVKKNIGKIDYATGDFSLANINVSAFSGNSIYVYAKMAISDISASLDRILSIRDSDIVIKVLGVSKNG